MELGQFRVSLEHAFAKVPYPSDDNITDCEYKRSCGNSCLDCLQIADYFHGKNWRREKTKDLRRNEDALNLFTVEALHYFLPAFVWAVLEDKQEADVLYDKLIFLFRDLTAPRTENIVARLTEAQRKVLIEYFAFCLETYGEYSKDSITKAICVLS